MTAPGLARDIVLQTLHGYAEVNRIADAERRARLPTLTANEARAIFEGLIQSSAELDESERQRLAQFRLEHHLKVRQAMERLSRALGHEPIL